MTTQFFERQEVERKYTQWLIWGFVAAILVVTVAINLVVLVGLGGNPLQVMREAPEIIFWVSLAVLITIGLACWHKSSEYRSGGAAVAQSLGGIAVTSGDGDIKLQRLVNIVEEMAIAARIRKPQVFVLPDEMGINAFAAGHSPDEAAVAVTQGALDAFDREQLQAVIGHEFSHILNGDMKINMRLTTWIFGLCVITDFARYIMNKRGGGKAAGRIKLIAFGIFVAGSAGALAGRLLQAAVSRRREHLADASAVQFTRNPQALQSAFVVMAASASGTRLDHAHALGVQHMFFARSSPAWVNKFGGSWFATHPPIEERVRAIDSRVTPTKFRSLVSDEKRKSAARAAAAAAAAEPAAPAAAAEARPAPIASVAPDALQFAPVGAAALADLAAVIGPSSSKPAEESPTARTSSGLHLTLEKPILAETMPSGVRMIAGKTLPPDVLRNRLAQDQLAAINSFVANVESSSIAVQATFVATMLASEPSKWRTQLTRLAPLLGIELLKETQSQIARIAELAPASRLPLLTDLMTLFDSMEPAGRKRLRAIARAFAPTVATGDMLRYSLTRMIEKRLAKAKDEATPVPLPDRAAAVCEMYAALAQCRFGVGKPGQNAYRAGLMGMLPPQKWAPYPDALITPAALDAALAGLAQIHPTGKRSLSEGMARVIAVGGRLTAPQVDLLRGVCMVVDCPVPVLPIDVVFEESDVQAPKAQASAR